MNYVFSIVNPEMSERMNAICASLGLPLCIESLGRGTATRSMLDLLGLSAREYHVVMTMADQADTETLIAEARRQLYIDAPGHGIIVATPIKSVGGGNTLANLNKGRSPAKSAPAINYNYEIILAIANEGYTDTVMDAARAAGARGGTVLHGKGTGSKDAEKFFSVSIASEKEVRKGGHYAIHRAGRGGRNRGGRRGAFASRYRRCGLWNAGSQLNKEATAMRSLLCFNLLARSGSRKGQVQFARAQSTRRLPFACF